MDIKGNTIVGRHIREENRLMTLNPLGHRPIEDIGRNDGPDKNSPEIKPLQCKRLIGSCLATKKNTGKDQYQKLVYR